MVDGMVLHPGHDELHGITVVVTGTSGRTYVGRWHERQPRGVVMRNVAILEASEGDPAPWLEKLRRFGVPDQHRTYVIPEEEFAGVARFDG